MPLLLLVLAALLPAGLFAQDTIKVDATDVIPVCTPSHPASAGPCATAPHPISNPSPAYSEKARKARREGVVVLGLVVNSDGSTRDIHVLKSLGGGLDEAAIDAVRRWKFDPGTYQGNPVAVQLSVQVNFRLGPASSPEADTPQASESLSEQVRNLDADAQAAYGRNDYQTAANLARRLTALVPRFADGWNLLGMSLLELHELDAAASALETSVSLDPTSAYAYNNLGRVYWRQRKYDDAIAQFQKQIALNPQDHYAHMNLGLVYRDRKMCGSAVPELEKAVAITPNNPSVLLALGVCHLDLGDKAKGLSEMEQATSESASAGTWNSAAYLLAERNIELDRAQKWAQNAVNAESVQLHGISLEHLSTAQLSRVAAIASYWDTLGWIYFRRGNTDEAFNCIQASWSLHQVPAVAYHLGQIYEAQGKREEATHAYAMAIAAADLPLIQPLTPDESDAVADAKKELAISFPDDNAAKKLVEQARSDLTSMGQVTVPNAAKAHGTAEFIVKIMPTKTTEVRQVSGDATLKAFTAVLESTALPMQIPPGSQLEIPRRGTLTCAGEQYPCRFKLLTSQEAVDLARKEDSLDVTSSAAIAASDPHTYNNSTLGMKIFLPDDWQVLQEQRGSYSRPTSATLYKPGAVAFFLLTRERMEGSPDLYSKMIEAGLSQRDDYHRNGEMEIKRDSIPGTRWNIGWKEKGVNFTAVMELFSVGDDHYRLLAFAPAEVYSRYTEPFEEMFRSVRFPMLHADPKILEGNAK